MRSTLPTSAVPAKAGLRGEILTKREPAWMTDAIRATVHGARGNAKVIAPEVGRTESYVTDVADPTRNATLKAYEIPAFIRATGDFQILDALEAQVGRVAFVLPSGEASDELHARVAATVKEFGEMLQTSGQALADGRLTSAERDALVNEIDESVRVLCEYRAAVITKASKDAAA
jgi:hypothetical protein